MIVGHDEYMNCALGTNGQSSDLKGPALYKGFLINREKRTVARTFKLKIFEPDE